MAPDSVRGRADVEVVGDENAGWPTPTPEPTPEPVAEPPGVLPPPERTEPPAPVAPIVPYVGDDERQRLAQMVCDAFPEDRFMCTHVVWAESIGDWNPNWHCTVYGGCWSPTSDCGLLQTNVIHAWRYAALGYDINVGCWIPEVNLAVARGIYNDQGPGAWTTHR